MKNITFATNPGAGSLDYVKLLIESLKHNLDNKNHEILVFVDNDTDGIVNYLRSEKNNFHDLKIVTHLVKPLISYQRNSSLIVDLAKYDIISYLHSDMVISKGYDTAVISELEENMVLSSTRIEPSLHPSSYITITKDLGLSPEDFNFDEFNSFAESVKENKSISYFFAPYTFHKSTWNKLGGYDTLFRRAREDSDFVQRCLHANVKLKQTYAANVYHFTCVTSRGKNWYDKQNQQAQNKIHVQSIADQIEIRRFIKKWGNFNHGESLLKKYDCDLVIKGSNKNLDLAYQLEPFFSRVWVQSQEDRDKLVKAHENQHLPANELLNFSNEDWKTLGKYYNQINYSDIYLVGEPENYSAKIILDLDSVEYNMLTQETLLNLSHLIEQTDPGDYESGNCIISIRAAKDITPPFKVENPPFDMSLLNIE